MFASSALLGACASPLPEKGVGPGSTVVDPPEAAGSPVVRFEPPAPPDAVTPVTRIFVEFPGALADPRAMLVAGALTASQLRDFGKPVVPASLTSRAVSTLVWLEPSATVVVVAPLAALEPGALYTLAVSAPLVSLPFKVAAGPSALARVWPDRDDVAPSARAAVWCGPSDLGPLDAPVTLEPALLAGRFTLGTGAPVAAPRCVSFFSVAPSVASDASAPPALAPPAVTFDDGTRAALEPTVLFDRDEPPAAVSSCVAPAIPFGPACAEVEDDRVVVHPGAEPLLWTIDFGEPPVVRASRGGASFTLRPLPAEGRCRVATLDRSGHVSTADVAIVPAAPRAHVVVNEVLANPAGAEPAQEWVELYNDGSNAVALEGWVLEDAGGSTPLPAAELASGGFALVVPDAYVADDGIDPPPAPGTILVRVPMLGRSGLSNEGEKLTLRDPAGQVMSTFPAVKTKNGVSVARTTPDAADADPAFFISSPNGSSTPGAPNGP
jgi:hypothetical protein